MHLQEANATYAPSLAPGSAARAVHHQRAHIMAQQHMRESCHQPPHAVLSAKEQLKEF
jgi:hypothetical protein